MDDYEFPVDRTAILNFAAALGETNPIYWDEAHAQASALGGVIAPPTFAVASALWNPEYGLRGIRQIPRRPAPPEPEGTGKTGGGGRRGGGSARLLHGEQHFLYHQPMRPGMRLTVSNRPGRSWDKEGKRGGKLRFTETITELRDERGELVVTATSVGIVTEKAVEG